jgi:hypothetical protein
VTVPQREVIKFGNAVSRVLFTLFLSAVWSGLLLMVVLAASLAGLPVKGRVMLWLVVALLGLAFGALVVVLLRSPRVLRATIIVSSDGVLMPARRFGQIPLDEVAGVGLVRMRNPRAGNPDGSWGVGVWRADGSVAFAGGLQFRSGMDNPQQTLVAAAARQLHEAVVRLQGPAGLLSQRELQRSASFSRWGMYTGAWDPTGPA